MIGIFIGMLCGIWLMCLLQINRDNELKNRIDKAIQYIKNNIVYDTGNQHRRDLLEILGENVE